MKFFETLSLSLNRISLTFPEVIQKFKKSSREEKKKNFETSKTPKIPCGASLSYDVMIVMMLCAVCCCCRRRERRRRRRLSLSCVIRVYVFGSSFDHLLSHSFL